MKKTDDAPRCWYGTATDPQTGKASGHTGPDHCPACAAEVETAIHRIRKN